MAAKLKLVHIISSLRIGGAEALLVDLIRELGNEQYEHHVLYFHDGPREQQLHVLGVKTYQLSGALHRYDPIMLWRASKLITQLQPDVIHAALWAGCWLGRLLGKIHNIPVFCVVHLPIWSDGKVRNAIDGATWRWATKVIAVSEGVAQSLEGKWVPTQKLSLIPNGIDYQLVRTQGLAYNKTRADLGLGPEHLVFGCVGRFVSHKRQDLLIKSFAEVVKELAHARLILMGVGPEEGKLRTLITELNLSSCVHIISGQPALGYYPLFDVFVLPSVLEGLSIALLESMCFGLPGIVVGAVLERPTYHDVVLHEQTGLVIPPNDQFTLTHALLRMADLEHRKSMGAAAEKRVQETFNLQNMTNAYRKLIFEMSSDTFPS